MNRWLYISLSTRTNGLFGIAVVAQGNMHTRTESMHKKAVELGKEFKWLDYHVFFPKNQSGS